jgi:2,3-bisphosphoglycerate-dependent phosphoglycerate mutase
MDYAVNDSGTVWLARHGESTWNVLQLVQGHAPGPTLTPKGREQAARLAEQFRDRLIREIYTSDLGRARETAAVIGRALGVPCHEDVALRERCFGTLEGHALSSLDPTSTGIAADRVVDGHARPLGGESLGDLYERVGQFVEQHLIGLQDSVLVVSHGGAIRALRAYCSGVAVEDMTWDVVSNASVWKIAQVENRLRVAP